MKQLKAVSPGAWLTFVVTVAAVTMLATILAEVTR